jgi:mannose-1-phosphate guanylyltransferase/mannose-6-phosphate isomerase
MGMKSQRIIPVVLCGGAGTRLWPASRESRPKQFIPLAGPRSPFQETILGVADREVFARPVVIANREHRFLVAEQLAAIGVEADILLEPGRRDSGPAVAAASYFALARNPDAVLLILAADHLVRRPDVFQSACLAALPAAEAGQIVVFGVTPEGPATGYGYIRPGEAAAQAGLRKVAAFVEKPDAVTAARYVAEGYLWNAGNFLFAASAMIEDYSAFEGASAEAVSKAVSGIEQDLGFHLLAAEPFLSAAAKSVDYAVMERTARAVVIPVDHGWSDLGTWNAIWEVGGKDANGNVGRGPVELLGSENSLAISDRTLVTVSGMNDVVVIADDDAILVTRRDDAEGMRKVVGHLRSKGYAQADTHARGYRPWGFYQSLDSGSRFQVKRIVVKPGAQLSLQRHAHRAEHWIVVRGVAEVTIGHETKILHENESNYIPQGAMHRLRNPGKIDLELIEVQTGSYLGEDDIERFDDIYGR